MNEYIEALKRYVAENPPNYGSDANSILEILKGSYSFVVKETAANILRFVAVDVNRFSAQRLVSDIKDMGVEPLLEDILES